MRSNPWRAAGRPGAGRRDPLDGAPAQVTPFELSGGPGVLLRPATRARTSGALALAALAALAFACKSAPPEPSVEDKLARELMDQGLLSRKDERGLVLYLPDVLFAFDRADLTDAANTKIAAVAEIVVRLAPERNLSVEGHTDAVGDGEYNLELSLRRAIAVSDALQAGGVAAERLRTVGHGERFPVAQNRTPEGRDDPAGRAANRRVEVVIERPS
jgi:outer membrane protein OmpA-like peptidoglycan-associated protein